MTQLGADPHSLDMDKILAWMTKFHAIAEECEVGVENPNYRYLMKRAYMHYLSTLPLYGCSLSEAIYSSEEGPREVIVALNSHHLYLLDSYNWNVVTQALLSDIEGTPCPLIRIF